MIKVESKVANYAINVPTKREDITPESLGKLLENVTVATSPTSLKFHTNILVAHANLELCKKGNF